MWPVDTVHMSVLWCMMTIPGMGPMQIVIVHLLSQIQEMMVIVEQLEAVGSTLMPFPYAQLVKGACFVVVEQTELYTR